MSMEKRHVPSLLPGRAEFVAMKGYADENDQRCPIIGKGIFSIRKLALFLSFFLG